MGIPEASRLRIQAAGKKLRQATVRELMHDLCALRAYTARELRQVLDRSDACEPARLHVKPMREAGVLTLLYPESEKHPHQTYPTVGAEGENEKEQGGDA